MRGPLELLQRARVVGWALAKGHWYKAAGRLRGGRFSAGRNFRCFGRLVLHGPGRVTFGDDVVVWGRVTPFTHSAEAHIRVGNHVTMDGVRFGCARSITIADECLVAESHILDTDFHSTRADRRTNPEAPIRTAPVTVERNAWIAGGTALLPGTAIGENSVVGYGAVCVRRYPPNSIIFGNPATVVAPVGQAPAAPAATGAPTP